MTKDFTKGLKQDPVSVFMDEPEPEQEQQAGVPYGYAIKPVAKTERVQLLIPKQMQKDVQKLAKMDKKSVNAEFNDAMVEYLKARGIVKE